MRRVLLVISSAVAGIGSMYAYHWLTGDQPPSVPYNYSWEKFLISAVVVVSFVLGFIEPKAPWRWPLIMAYGHYVTGFFVMRVWGQIPPIEFIYVTLLSLPGIGAAYVGRWLAKKAI